MSVAQIDKLTDDLRSLLDEARLSGESIQIVDNGVIVAHIVPSPQRGAVSMTAGQLAQRLGGSYDPISDDTERFSLAARRAQTEAVITSMDDLAEKIAAAWPEGISALDAIDDVRREI